MIPHNISEGLGDGRGVESITSRDTEYEYDFDGLSMMMVGEREHEFNYGVEWNPVVDKIKAESEEDVEEFFGD